LSGSENDQDSTDSKTHNKKRSPIYDLTFACDKDGKKLENEDIASKYRNCNHCKKIKAVGNVEEWSNFKYSKTFFSSPC